MEVKNQMLYHIHRKNNIDKLWQVGNCIIVDDNFKSIYYDNLLSFDNGLKERYGETYDIDYIIAIMEELLFKQMLEEEDQILIKRLKFLRREQALEEGRKLYNPNAQQRFHSIYLTDKTDLNYWKNCVGNNSFEELLLEISGNLFESSDTLFPDENLMLDRQIEESKKYWQPNKHNLCLRKEYLFQGKARIIR